ncbi:TIGR03960 family B12-binding radical SAM protein [Desulfopila sp. IMCC35008]|uniref:TIGR03960 family B12-binding radical SAM protein n=1 Tax=Desulfopila sp. IMCC35008 TaxID=2653858 RepID=UPI0013D1F6D4|nr:TIGR03960 family B12-binding radical SAM protein [Desulfopila sp. IMCC35008]
MTDTSFLARIQKPGRYTGCEYNSVSVHKDTAKIHCGLLFPDLYEIGMSHQGLQILYHILNKEESVRAERCYCPDKDAEALLKNKKLPLCTLESGKPLAELDMLGFTLPYELCYTNILTMLELAGIPFLSKDRDHTFPLIIGGGACSMNPEPVADFFDAILLGDGEEAILEIAETLLKAREKQSTRGQLLEQLSGVEGIYIPSWYEPQYDEKGSLTTMTDRQGNSSSPTRRVLPDLDRLDHLLTPIVPNAKIVHDRLGVEVARGCTRGCRFCQAGITYRPVRERSPQQVMQLANEGIANSGFDELALLSLSTGDYSCLGEVLPQLMNRFAGDYVSVAMPSMRVGTLTPEIMDQIKRVRKTGFTIAPEAGSERLRRVINKGITEEDLLSTCTTAFSLGWKVMKFYFMIGLPTETDEDIDEIVNLIQKIKKETNAIPGGKKQVTVSIGTFVPKPHTPFQWTPQLTIEESRHRISILKKNLPRKGCSLKYHDPEQSYLEGVFSRGDRRLSALLIEAWKIGARLDGWSDYFNLALWRQAAEKISLNLDFYLRERGADELLPWGHLDTGVDIQFLQEERDKALQEIYTPDCRYHGCQQCGLCDFETIRPIVHDQPELSARPADHGKSPSLSALDKRAIPAHDENHIKYIVHYSRRGNICYLGHLEILQLVFRALRRADITTNYSKGYNPSPKVAFGPALPVGTQSQAEFFIMDLPAPLKSTDKAARDLSDNLPPGLTVTSIELHSGQLPQAIENFYTLQFEKPLSEAEQEKIKQFMAGDELVISRIRKGKHRQFNIRPLFTRCDLLSAATMVMQIISKSGVPGIKPIDALSHILQRDVEELIETKITKTSWQPVDES